MKVYLLKWRCSYPSGSYVPDQKEKIYKTEVGVRRRIAHFQKRNALAAKYPTMSTFTNIELFEIDAPLRKMAI